MSVKKKQSYLKIRKKALKGVSKEYSPGQRKREKVLKQVVKEYPDLGDMESTHWKIANLLCKIDLSSKDPASNAYKNVRSVNAPRIYAYKAKFVMLVLDIISK